MSIIASISASDSEALGGIVRHGVSLLKRVR